MAKAPTPTRYSTLTRTTLARVPYSSAPARPLPRWLRRLLLALLALLLLLLTLVSCNENEKPPSLADSALTGTRRTTGPVCVEEAVDLSSSMTQYVPQREQAEGALFEFARRELAPQDRMSEVYFAGSAVVALTPTSMVSLTSAPAPVGAGVLEDGTLLAPAVAALIAARASGPDDCAARALVMITDGVLGDDPNVLNDILAKANYTRMYAVIPSGPRGADRAGLRGGLLDSVIVYGFHDGGVSGRAASILGDAKPLDVVFGEILGGLTGQHLSKIDPSRAVAGTQLHPTQTRKVSA